MWKIPAVTKIYEALGCVEDGRIEVNGNKGKCYSSSRNKFYDITYNPAVGAIMSNDNTSYWKDELGYPAVAFLLKKGVLEYRPELGELLKGVPWKDINQKFNNDFAAALEYVLEKIDKTDREKLREYTEKLVKDIERLKLKKLGKKVFPPRGY